mgnify:CR=1 FL=1
MQLTGREYAPTGSVRALGKAAEQQMLASAADAAGGLTAPRLDDATQAEAVALAKAALDVAQAQLQAQTTEKELAEKRA